MSAKQKSQIKVKELKPRNYVAESEILTQAINMENKNIRINSEFAFNPRRINVIPSAPLTQKLQNQNEIILSKEKTEAVGEFKKYLKTEVQEFYDTPNNKQAYPLTTSQQIGWFTKWVI